eukprot:sb/3469081/
MPTNYWLIFATSASKCTVSCNNTDIDRDVINTTLFWVIAPTIPVVLAFSIWSSIVNLKRRTLSGRLYILIHILDVLILILTTLKFFFAPITQSTEQHFAVVSAFVVFCVAFWHVALCASRIILIASPFYQINEGRLWLGTSSTMIVYSSGSAALIKYYDINSARYPEGNSPAMSLLGILLPLPIVVVLILCTVGSVALLNKANPHVPVSREKKSASWTVVIITCVYFVYLVPKVANNVT